MRGSSLRFIGFRGKQFSGLGGCLGLMVLQTSLETPGCPVGIVALLRIGASTGALGFGGSFELLNLDPKE